MARPFPTSEFLRAVDLEINAVLTENPPNESVVPLVDGKISEPGLYEYRTVRKCPPYQRVLIRPKNSTSPWIPGRPEWLSDRHVRIAVESPLIGDITAAQLREDESTALYGLARCVENAEKVLNLDAAGWAIGRGRATTVARCTTTDSTVRNYAQLPLNAQQRAAVEQALGSEVTFIWGPPGTGKTAVLGHIVEGCVRQGFRVLFVAPTKVAVDQAMQRICESLCGEPGFDTGLVQRIGEIELQSLAGNFGRSIDPEQLLARFDTELSTRSAAAEETVRRVHGWFDLFDEHANLVSTRNEVARNLHSNDEQRRNLIGAWQAAQARLQVAGGEVAAVGSPSGLLARQRQNKLDALYREIADLQAKEAESKAMLGRMNTYHEQQGLLYGQVIERIGALETALTGAPDRANLAAQRDQAVSEIDAIAEARKNLPEALRDRCRVFGATVAKVIQAPGLARGIDVVIVDEAAMVALPMAWCVAGMAAKRVVFAGDFRQLPAVTRASGRALDKQDAEHAAMWMDRDVFSAAGLVTPGGTVQSDDRLVALSTQYRMRPGICALVNRIAYPDKPLVTARDDATALAEDDSVVSGPLVLVDTTGIQGRLGFRETARAGSYSSNPVHEAVIHELVRHLQFETVLPARKSSEGRADERLAVIAPYRDQVRALRKSLNERFGEKYDGLVDTVHRFQGSERPIVIIDTVAGAGKKVGPFYESSGLSSSTTRLMNVAVSRARDHLIVVADVGFLLDKLLPSGEARAMIQYLTDFAHRIPALSLVPIRSADQLGDLSPEDLRSPAFFPKDEVPRAVAWDFRNAATSIDIYCPFLNRTPTQRWLRQLRPRIENNIRVRVHTRPQEADTSAAALVDELRNAGCDIHFRDRMHEKVVIIDGEVLWHGSLNLLADDGPTDLMMRITDRASCERVVKIMDRARMERPARTGWKSPEAPAPTRSSIAPEDRLYLNVSYHEKDVAKQTVGAQWDRDRKQWYVSKDTDPEKIRRWLR